MRPPRQLLSLVFICVVHTGCSASGEVTLPTPSAEPTAVPSPTPVPTPIQGDSADREASFLLVDPDPAATDDALAELEADRTLNQIIVTADFRGCILNEVFARPEPTRVLVSAFFDPDVDCVRAFEYRALFLIDRQGESAYGAWDYPQPPPVVVELLD